ncbi:hypothetical protein J19TS2_21850 [Cohnella xylanilytica]|uniref:Uncharacterized protein n=1 Tax=Cohnella xylanilytica TaxID=557555 RepID=A0A841U4D8_9BACL|nr:hypothetical protein [Cohnella xylanilytica]MBB6695577.1 hypothetical protein [Cohnella xylanilytica]GIO12630.1 hypothetical protein J19TS2_21850 [Cohnella xylanilytica]
MFPNPYEIETLERMRQEELNRRDRRGEFIAREAAEPSFWKRWLSGRRRKETICPLENKKITST